MSLFGCLFSGDWSSDSLLVLNSAVPLCCWCATHEQIRMAFHRFHFRMIRSSWSSVIAVTPRSSFMILASASVSSVGVVTIFSGHLSWYGSHDGPCYQRSEHTLTFPPRLPKSAGSPWYPLPPLDVFFLLDLPNSITDKLSSQQ